MIRVVWSGIARGHLKAIGDYYAQDNAGVANKILNRIKSTADTLSTFPEMGRDGRVAGTLEEVMHDYPYIIVYQITDKEVRILAVLHTSRKWPNSF